MKKTLILISSWLLLTGISAGVGFLIVNPLPDYRLSKYGVMTKGQVTRKEPDKHRLIHYTFVVEGKLYDGVGNSRNGNPDFEDIVIGQEVIVFYDPQRPEVSCLGYPQSQFKKNLAGIVFVALILPCFIMVPLVFILKVVGGTRSSK